MKKTLISFAAVAFVGVIMLASPVFAQNERLNTKPVIKSITAASSTASTTIKRAAKLDQETARLQTRAGQEIDRRIAGLNKLQDKIQGMKKISASDKTSFATTVQGQINLLENLKIKINADIDAATLKADVQFITKAYRIYALILPQIEIVAAADRLASTTGLVSAYAAKLQIRITAAQTEDKNITPLQLLLTDMNAKISDANVQSAKAIVGVISLKPDNGDKTLMASNTTALKAAQTIIKTGTQDVKDANKDALKIRAGLKAFTSTTATSTATTTISR